MTDTAFRTTDSTVVAQWQALLDAANETKTKRAALREQYGRDLYVNRSGFGHGTRVTAFERFDSDKDGDLLAGGALIVSTKRGQHNGLVVPNLRRKAGKEFAEHLREYDSPLLDLNGMPKFHIGGEDGVRVHAPEVFGWAEAVYVRWGTEVPGIGQEWESIPLSVYYAAREAHDAEQ